MKHMNPVDLKLYLVTDSGYYDEKRFLDMVEKACRGGVTLLQLREKNRGGGSTCAWPRR